MHKLRVCPDTSVIGGCLDAGFADDSRRVVAAVCSGRLTALVSEVVLRELEAAPDAVREILL